MMDLTQKTIDSITVMAGKSDLARYRWRDRDVAPIGYIKGMAVCFGLMLTKLRADDSAAKAMVRVVDGPGDVFDHYQDILERAGMRTAGAPDADRLRYLFVILAGLGMRESSGRYCCGRDTTAQIPPSSDTVEAGLFQQSWDSRRTSPELPKLLAAYSASPKEGFLSIFREGVTVKAGDLDNTGSGDGAKFQQIAKTCPLFAVEAAAIALRTLYPHWGPIVRREVEIRSEANDLFKSVQNIVDALEPSAGSVAKPGGKSWLDTLIDAIARWFRGMPAATPVPPPVELVSSAPWMTWALKEVGFHEIGTNRGIDKYISLARVGSSGDPWCAIFINAALESSGIAGSRSAMARSFESHGGFVKLAGPAYGAIVTMWRGSQDSGKGHVFFYLGENDKGVIALGGNQDNQVCRQYEPRNRIVGYYWPKSVPLPKVGKIILANVNVKEGSET